MSGTRCLKSILDDIVISYTKIENLKVYNKPFKIEQKQLLDFFVIPTIH